MRTAFLLGLLVCLGAAQAAAPAARALEFKPTIYDDGRSCPGGCDAHVVLHPSHNGTRHASLPSSSRGAPAKCQAGQPCRICFGEGDDTCMTALYRGGGPAPGRFDFTPAFYDAHCGQPGIPAALALQCASMDKAVQNRGYGGSRINCFAQPEHALCRETMQEAVARQAADAPERERCLSLGQNAYNQQQADPAKRRSNGCAYSSRPLGGPNSKGEQWRILLPGACREGTYAGRHGLDCCSNNVRFAASVHPECTAFFPQP